MSGSKKSAQTSESWCSCLFRSSLCSRPPAVTPRPPALGLLPGGRPRDFSSRASGGFQVLSVFRRIVSGASGGPRRSPEAPRGSQRSPEDLDVSVFCRLSQTSGASERWERQVFGDSRPPGAASRPQDRQQTIRDEKPVPQRPRGGPPATKSATKHDDDVKHRRQIEHLWGPLGASGILRGLPRTPRRP